jgi:hypothetical protein
VLRASAAGADLDRTLTPNRAWIAAAAARFDVAAWLAPRGREVILDGAPHRLSVERDPVEVLRMGIPFHTCLSLEKGCNAASTVLNAADANKRVIYLRDAAGHILARKLVAVSKRDEMIGYRLYVAAAEQQEAIAAAFAGLCAEMAAAAGLPLASSGEPEPIHPGFWYDDGTVPFEAAAVEPGVEAYCAALGRPVPAVVSESLRREAAAAGALAAGDAPAVTALLCDGWQASGPRARAASWLLARLGPEEIVALSRRSPVLAAAAAARAAEAGARPLLELCGRIAEWRSAELAATLVDRFPRTAEVAAALVAAGHAARRHGAAFDDHGLEHQTMYLLPAYLAAIPVAAALALCDEVEPLWDWVAAQGCNDCRDAAAVRSIEAIASGYASARDPEAVIRALEAGRTGLLARRAALRVAAQYALAEEGPLPALPPPRLQRVRPCPAAMRALARLRQRAPDLAGEPDLFAALLRQSAGALPHGVALPVPRDPPFEALGDLLAQLQLAGVLRPWLSVGAVASAWEPGPWELYFHRRHETARRVALRAEAARAAPRPSHATDQLAWLGDVAALRLVAAAVPDAAPAAAARAAAPPAMTPLLHARQVAVDIAAQIEAAEALGAPTIDENAVARPITAGNGGRRLVDPGLTAALLAEVERALAGDGAGVARRFAVLVVADPAAPALRRLVERLAARPALGVEETEAVTTFLRGCTTFFCPELSPDLALALARHEALRPALFEALARTGEGRFAPAVLALRAAAHRAGEGALFDICFDAWVTALLGRGGYEALAELDDDALFRRAVQLALAGPAAAALGVFQETQTHAQAAAFLDELGRSEARRAAAMRAAVAALRGWGAEADHAARYAWLRAVMKEGPAPGG